jgi:SAM-dependent methyltransferase
MEAFTEMNRPDDLDWQAWLARHDRMQERYFIRRDERFQLITRLISETQQYPIQILDLGCGAGHLMFSVLQALPQAEVMGIDLDPTALWLSGARLERFETRCRLIMADFLDASWPRTLDGPLAAVVTSQTFHMLDADQLAALYNQIAQVLRPGGMFLCADHARSDSLAIQQAWERQRREVPVPQPHQDVDDWDGFWHAYSEALGVDISEIHGRLYGGRKSRKKERLALVWHLTRLLDSGFSSAECFWRREFDAVYGGERSL